jgi:hypothetical protein
MSVRDYYYYNVRVVALLIRDIVADSLD